MALITCPECKKKISDIAVSCPNCGYKLTPEKVAEIKKKEQQAQKGYGKVCLAVIAIFAILFMIYCFSLDSQKIKPSTSKTQEENRKEQTGLPVSVSSQDSQTQANATFKNIVNNYESFFKSPQKLLYKQKYSGSDSGYLYYICEYECGSISYDIQKTDSLISPYLGIIDLDLISKENGSCGDVESHQKRVGWKNSSDAIKHSNDSGCFRYLLDKPIKDPVRLYFAYQDSKWVFKKAIRTNYNRPPLDISATYGIEIEVGRKAETSEEIAFNKKWSDILNQD